MPAVSETRPVFGFASAGAGVCACAVLATVSAPNIIAATARRMLPISRRLIVACPPVGCRRIRRREQGICRTYARTNTHTYPRRPPTASARHEHPPHRCLFRRHEPQTRDASARRETETRPGSPGARRTIGGIGGPFEAP